MRGGGWKAAGGVLVEPGLGVSELAVAAAEAEFEVQVSAGGIASRADITDVLPGGDVVADIDVNGVRGVSRTWGVFLPVSR